jgi:hypothetical protein
MTTRIPALLSAALGLAAGLSLPLSPAPARAEVRCPQPVQGRFAVMGSGLERSIAAATTRSTPTAHLLEERWLAGGRLEGTLMERRGRSERSGRYSGSVRLRESCVLEVERNLPWGTERSEVVLDGRGRPLYSISRRSGSVVTSRWLPMASGSCQPADLDGLVLSSQVGLSWKNGGWSPNAVVQREQWRAGSVQGIALSSYDGVGETATYTGSLQLDRDSCWGSLREVDAQGTTYNYRALLVKGRSGARGYLYLQNDPNDLTAGWLVRD